ncbi:MAG: oxygen-independent coproporphyrinogen III oxidase [Pseudomonadota bacterium]
MDQVNTLRRYGLFDAKVPRYTSYPPANRFTVGTGAVHHKDWLAIVPEDQPLSLYIHIPFCRRLCWFCACRTQGTRSLAPVEAYVETLLSEIDVVARMLPALRPTMARLHLGGGTPTLLSAGLMKRLLDRLFTRFAPTSDFELSTEVDPTEADRSVLDVLVARGMTRASVGVQDFAPKVQKAIGRIQGVEVTRDVISYLRDRGVRSLNIDFLYGLPYQTAESLSRTLDQVVALGPDRLALYGYAHVPHVSKRQVMIPSSALPGGEARFLMAQLARERLVELGYQPIGIDHFARRWDGLVRACRARTLTRNFQGYTDDPFATLLGLGASAISKFPQGYVQNAVATSAYIRRVEAVGFAGQKGAVLTADDKLVAALIDAIMCYGAIDEVGVVARFPDRRTEVNRMLLRLKKTFPDLVDPAAAGLALKADLTAAARLIAAELDRSGVERNHHSAAV